MSAASHPVLLHPELIAIPLTGNRIANGLCTEAERIAARFPLRPAGIDLDQEISGPVELIDYRKLGLPCVTVVTPFRNDTVLLQAEIDGLQAQLYPRSRLSTLIVEEYGLKSAKLIARDRSIGFRAIQQHESRFATLFSTGIAYAAEKQDSTAEGGLVMFLNNALLSTRFQLLGAAALLEDNSAAGFAYGRALPGIDAGLMKRLFCMNPRPYLQPKIIKDADEVAGLTANSFVVSLAAWKAVLEMKRKEAKAAEKSEAHRHQTTRSPEETEPELIASDQAKVESRISEPTEPMLWLPKNVTELAVAIHAAGFGIHRAPILATHAR